MKTKILIVIQLIVINAALATEPEAVWMKRLRPVILQEIDSVCADTWCEGDFRFEFIEVEQTTPKELRIQFKMRNNRIKHRVNVISTANDDLGNFKMYAWLAVVNGEKGEWEVFVWLRDDKTINNNFSPVAYERLTAAIGWAEEMIKKGR